MFGFSAVFGHWNISGVMDGACMLHIAVDYIHE
jgi:hypothetical protein